MSASHAESSSHYDLVVSGGGPVGMASALEALRYGKRVAIISDRPMENLESFSRGQRIFLDEASRYYLLKFFPDNYQLNDEDQKFFKILTTNTTIRVRDIERFLFRRIEEHKQKNPQSVAYYTAQKLNHIDMKAGEIHTVDAKNETQVKEKITFTNLLGADGAGHYAANVLNKHLEANNEKPAIKYKKIAAPGHAYHASVYVKIKRTDGKSFELPSNQFIEVATKANDGYTYLAGISINSVKNTNEIKCVFGGEVPISLHYMIMALNGRDINTEINKLPEEEKKKVTKAMEIHPLYKQIMLLNNKDTNFNQKEKGAIKDDIKKEVMKHMQKVYSDYFKKQGLHNGELEVQLSDSQKKKEKINKKEYRKKKDILNLQAFRTDLTKANKAVYEENGHQFLLAGDAYRTPNYQFGHGLNDAFLHAQYVGQLVNNNINEKEYNKRCDNLSKNIENANSFLNKLGSIGAAFLLKVGNKRPDRIRRQFEGIKDAQLATILAPLSDYINQVSLLTANRVSAIRLMDRIKTANNADEICDCIEKKVNKMNSKYLPKAVIDANSYKQVLDKLYTHALEYKNYSLPPLPKVPAPSVTSILSSLPSDASASHIVVSSTTTVFSMLSSHRVVSPHAIASVSQSSLAAPVETNSHVHIPGAIANVQPAATISTRSATSSSALNQVTSSTNHASETKEPKDKHKAEETDMHRMKR